MCTTAYIIALYVTLLAREAYSLAALDQLGSLQLCRASAASEEAYRGGQSEQGIPNEGTCAHREACVCAHGGMYVHAWGICVHTQGATHPTQPLSYLDLAASGYVEPAQRARKPLGGPS